MDRPRRKIISRCLEYNNGMLHEEEVALRQALRASLIASKTTDNDEDDPKPMSKVKKSDNNSSVSSSLVSKKKQKTRLNVELTETKESTQRSKRKSDESIDTGDKKRQKKLLVRIKPRSRKDRSGSNGTSKDIFKKKVVKSKILKEKKKMAVKENEMKMVKRRRKKKNVDNMKHDDKNVQTTESLPKVHVQRKFAQTYPASPKSLLQYQSQMQPMKTRAKTEDFLDFLCLRGSSHMPKTLEMFNSPCAPMSPLTDEDEGDKMTPPKISTTTEKNDNEPDAKQSLVVLLNEGHSSNSSSLVSSPVSTRVQPHTVLPQFTNNHGVLTHIPTPIPYPKPPTHTHQPGLDAYGALSSTSVTPSLIPNHPLVSSIVMGTHMPPSAGTGEKQGFHLVSQSGSSSRDTKMGSLLPQKVGENVVEVAKSPKQSPSKRPEKIQAKSPKESPSKRQDKGQTKSAKVSPKKVLGKKKPSPKKSVNSGAEIKKEIPKTSKNIKTDSPGSVTDDGTDGQTSVPVFSPTEVEFKNPLKYIESIKAKAEPFGICVIVPPKTWQPEYCLSDEIRFTTKLQRIHCLGKSYPTVEYEVAAIRKHLGQQSILLSTMPQIAGCEIDLPFMSKIVEEFGGLQQIIDKRKWGKIADRLCVPKTAVDRTTKLEHIYYKYLLSYDLLSKEEKAKLQNDVLEERNKKSGSLKKSHAEYITKGRSMSLAIFQRNAKNISEFYMKQANVKDVEEVFWQMIDEGQRYVVVHTAEVDSTAFPTSKTKPFYKSKWNLNILPKTPGSLARDLPDVEGITSPMVKVEMVLSAETWHKPPHDFYTMEYLHQGADKIWYSVPSCSNDNFMQVINAELGLEVEELKDCMIHHSSLTKSGISLLKVVQESGQFIVKFPGAYHSSLSTGFAVSEFVSFAPMSYLPHIKTTFQGDLKSEVDHMFSWDSLIVSSIKEELRRNSSEDTLSILIPELKELRDVETRLRRELDICGVQKSDSNELPDKKSRGRRVECDEIENCNECNRFCFPSAVMDQSNTPLCLHHGLEKLKQDKSSTLTLRSHLSLSDMNDLVKEAEEKLEQIRSTPKVRKRQAKDDTEHDGNKVEK